MSRTTFSLVATSLIDMPSPRTALMTETISGQASAFRASASIAWLSIGLMGTEALVLSPSTRMAVDAPFSPSRAANSKSARYRSPATRCLAVRLEMPSGGSTFRTRTIPTSLRSVLAGGFGNALDEPLAPIYVKPWRLVMACRATGANLFLFGVFDLWNLGFFGRLGLRSFAHAVILQVVAWRLR